MSVKQDRTGARTPAQLEQKYSFGKKFSEILGLIDDSREKVDSVESELRDEITKTSTELSRTVSDVSIKVNQIKENGVEQVKTTTGYTFDINGLTISKSGEQMENIINNKGMYVIRSGEKILTADHEGVDAVNLHAKTYLIIGAEDGRSRFEDYGMTKWLRLKYPQQL